MSNTPSSTIEDLAILEALNREMVAYHHALDQEFRLSPEKYAPDYFKN